ncbi:hypothetical protein [Lentzea sp. NBRC 102530]|uniref:hypothetical protein n=1 Tax=Lentzea sp. NBRC 102530 TaxID=3032201 RepID=UPI0024A16A73|nr:hypothetical protein [Lentzea sp. NBRC 102530]GLY55186.1 hypothetical protein Lesp01_88410 [Lentzea sp. NBRC 102530]
MRPDTQYALSLLTIWSVPALVLVVASRGRDETFGQALKRLDIALYWWMAGGLFATGAWWAAVAWFGLTVPLIVAAWFVGDQRLKRTGSAARPTPPMPAKSAR